MATSHRIIWVKKSQSAKAHERISHIGGRAADGRTWLLSQQSAVQGLESGRWQFHIDVGGGQVAIVIATDADGNKYLKAAVDDDDQPEALLALPDFPA